MRSYIGGRALSLLCLLGLLAAAPGHAQSLAAREPPSFAAGSCEAAIARAQIRYALPPGLLFAIGLAESGRVDPATGRMRPWPWAVQAGGRSLYFDTRAEAVAWVQDARASGTASVDTGCLQVNLMFHPNAFATINAAFDPDGNVDYAARFLVSLHDETKDWGQAIGFYHSRTPALASPYRERVEVNMGLPAGTALAASARPPSLAEQLTLAWRATTEPPAGPASSGQAPSGQAPSGQAAGAQDWSTLLQRERYRAARPSASARRIVATLSTR